MSKTENISSAPTILGVEASSKTLAKLESEPTPVSSAKNGKKLLTTDVKASLLSTPPTPVPTVFAPPVSEGFTTADIIDPTLNEKKEEELRKHLANMRLLLEGLNQYALMEASEDQASDRAKEYLLSDPSPAVKKAGVDLLTYMMTLMNVMVLTMANQATVGQESTDMSKSMIQIAKDQLTRANDDLAKLQSELYAEAHRSWFEKLWSAIKSIVDIVCLPFAVLSGLNGENVGSAYKAAFAQFCQDNQDSAGVFTYLVSGLMIMMAVVTGGTSLAVMGAFMFMMQVTGAQDELDTAIKNTGMQLGWQIVTQISVAIGEAIVLAGVSGLIDSAVETSSSASTQTAADMVQTIFQNAKNLFAKLGRSCAESSDIEMADFAANGAVAENVAASTAAESSFSTFLQNAGGKAFGASYKSAMLGKTLLLSAPTTLWGNVTKEAIDTWNAIFNKTIDTNDEAEATEISGAILAVLAGVGGALLDVSQGSTNAIEKIVVRFGEQRIETIKKMLAAMTSLMALDQSAYMVLQGTKQLEIGETLKDLRITQGFQAILSDMLDRLQGISKSNNNSMNDEEKDDADVNGRMDLAFVTPLEIFGS